MLVDVHAHLDFKDFEKDLDDVVARAKDAGLTMVVCNGIDLETNKKVLELSKKYDIIKPAFGAYPTDVDQLSDKEIDELFSFIEQNIDKCVALGEVGLDYKNDHDVVKQKKVLQRIFELAKKYDKPIIVHSRKAEEDVVNLVEQSGLKRVNFHCFSGKFSLVKRIEENGWMMSIPPNIVKSEQFQKMAREVSLKNLLTETDSPFLGPVRGERNEPSNVLLTIEKISELRSLDKSEVEKIIFMNAQKFFS